MLGTTFNLQGHRGARGLKPGNTLPSFEVALDVGVTSVETDLHLSRDGQVIVAHDPILSERQCRKNPQGCGFELTSRPLISSLTREELAGVIADVNPDPALFPEQGAAPTPVAAAFAHRHLNDNSFALVTLDELFSFVEAYAGELGKIAGKTDAQRARAAQCVLDLELKRVPGRPEKMGDDFDGRRLAQLEEKVLECIQSREVVERTVVRSFDHRSIRAIKEREPRVRTAALVANTAPVAPEELAKRAGATMYCVDVHFLDELQVGQLHAAGIAVLPWTVNVPHDWERLLDWGVDGITTDYPDQLAVLLRERGIPF